MKTVLKIYALFMTVAAVGLVVLYWVAELPIYRDVTTDILFIVFPLCGFALAGFALVRIKELSAE